MTASSPRCPKCRHVHAGTERCGIYLPRKNSVCTCPAPTKPSPATRRTVAPYPGPWKVDLDRYEGKTTVYITGPSPASLGRCEVAHHHEDEDCSIPEDIAEVSPGLGSMDLKDAKATARFIVKLRNAEWRKRRK